MTDTILNGISDRLQDARKAAKMSQSTLGNAVELNQRTISSYENGTALPTLEKLYEIADVLKTDPVLLLTGFHEENYTLSKDLGLSDESILTLKKWKQITDKDKPYIAGNDVAEAVDLLLQNIPLLFQIRKYLTEGFHSLLVFNDEFPDAPLVGRTRSIHADEVRTINLQDFEALHRLKLLDSLSEYRKKILEARLSKRMEEFKKESKREEGKE
ncbi:MAG: helix-turn-helix transcriptional regulator [Clostridia bacterium]|nr:helix-turn-helix transcriptional regulator [Clostridia bacterium]